MFVIFHLIAKKVFHFNKKIVTHTPENSKHIVCTIDKLEIFVAIATFSCHNKESLLLYQALQ